MRRRRTGPPRGTSIGMFAGNPVPPQDPTTAIVGELEDSLTGDAGLRLSYTTGRRLWFSGSANIQTFVRSGVNPNSESLDALPIAINARRTLGRFRGAPS